MKIFQDTNDPDTPTESTDRPKDKSRSGRRTANFTVANDGTVQVAIDGRGATLDSTSWKRWPTPLEADTDADTGLFSLSLYHFHPLDSPPTGGLSAVFYHLPGPDATTKDFQDTNDPVTPTESTDRPKDNSGSGRRTANFTVANDGTVQVAIDGRGATLDSTSWKRRPTPLEADTDADAGFFLRGVGAGRSFPVLPCRGPLGLRSARGCRRVRTNQKHVKPSRRQASIFLRAPELRLVEDWLLFGALYCGCECECAGGLWFSCGELRLTGGGAGCCSGFCPWRSVLPKDGGELPVGVPSSCSLVEGLGLKTCAPLRGSTKAR